MEANNMNPDQTASKRTEHSYLVPYCLQYRLHKQMTGVEDKICNWWTEG